MNLNTHILALVGKSNKAHDDDLMDLETSTNKQTKKQMDYVRFGCFHKQANDYVHLVVSTNELIIICIPVPTRVLVGTRHHKPNLSLWVSSSFNHCTLLSFSGNWVCWPCLPRQGYSVFRFTILYSSLRDFGPS